MEREITGFRQLGLRGFFGLQSHDGGREDTPPALKPVKSVVCGAAP
jgi:hypothetical protein